MIKTKISIDLLNPGPKKVLYTVQGDEYSRGVDFAVYKNNVPYDELDSFSASFPFLKKTARVEVTIKLLEHDVKRRGNFHC